MRQKELRIALVCYGGISLAVYMHGITKEIWRVARASRAWLDGTDGEGVERIYLSLLTRLEAESGIRLRVFPDIIAGASAGGINGIFLAQALATGQSLEPLTELWLEQADVDRLLDPQAKARGPLSKLWATPLAWALAGRRPDADDAEVGDKLHRFMRGRWFEPPFSGAVFTRLLLDAFDAMAASPPAARLLPPAQPLDLFVTVTDFHGYAQPLALHSPPGASETEHRLTLAFRDLPGGEALPGAPALTYAARATASFPGAFPPFVVDELDRVLAERGDDWPERPTFLRAALRRQDAPERVVLIDGSVLANAPFAPAIAALTQRPSKREVERRFVYLDPKPGVRSISLGGGSSETTPGFFQTLLGALSDLPRHQPIGDDLRAIALRSRAIERRRQVVEAIRPQVDAAIEALFGAMLFIDRPTPARLANWRARAEERSRRDAGHAHAAYLQLRLAELLDAGNEAALPAMLEALANDGLARFLDRHDRGYRRRRLRFLIRRLVALVDAGMEVEDVLDTAYRALDRLERQKEEPAAHDLATDAALAEAIARLPKEHRRAPLLNWLGFPFFDVATFPMLQGEGHDEFDGIKIDRIAPDDAQTLRQGDASATLKGIRWSSFGAFFSRRYRENDYLWGRLHGAERMIDIIVSAVPGAHLPPPEVERLKLAAFDAILDEEGERCAAVAPLIATLRASIATRRATL